MDEQGHKQGQITADTRYIVIGDAPDKSSPEFMKNNGEILRDAERYQVRKMTLGDFKQQMDYQKSSSVEHFGSGDDVQRRRPGRPATTAGQAAKAAAEGRPTAEVTNG